MRRLIERYIPPALTDFRERAWAQYLIVLALAATPFWVAFSLWYALALGHSLGGLLLALVGVGCVLVLPALRYSQSLSLGANMLAGITFGGITGLALLRGGFPFPVLLWSIVIPVAISRQNVFRRLAPYWVAACIAQFATFYVLARTGHAPTGVVQLTDAQLLDEYFIVLLAFLLLMLIVSYSSARVTDSFASERDEYLEALVHAQRVEALGSLAGGLAHDFNNILTAVQFSADVIAYELPEDHRSQREVVHLREAIDRSRGLTRQLLNLGRSHANEPTPLHVNVEIERIVGMLTRVLGSAVHIELSLGERLPRVRIDPNRLEQVLINLGVNAQHAMTDTPRLSIRSFKSGSSVVIEVADNGCGIEPEVAEHIFDAFFTTKGEDKGSGLGLWISRKIIRDAGGDLTLDSVPGRGSTFQIKLPPHRAMVELAAGSRTITAIPERTGARILLVDDDDGVLRALELALTKRGYDVICANSCERAMDLAVSDELEIDLVLADIMLPGMPGTELATRLREARPSLKVLLMSGHGKSDMPAAFIAKPFKDDELAEVIRDSLSPESVN